MLEDHQYHALHHGAVVIDRSDRGRMSFHGPKSADVLNGLLTNDVSPLRPGQGQYSAALTAKGRVIADVRVFASEDGFMVDVPPRAWDGWRAMIKKFVNPRLSAYRDESRDRRDIGVFGVEAHHVVASVTGLSPATLGALAAYSHVGLTESGDRLASVPDLSITPATVERPLLGFELFVDSSRFDRLWSSVLSAGAVAAGADLWTTARVEAGRPEWGIDFDETTIAQEANLESLSAMSFTKGCYTGQEVVARVHFRGHVNRHLRGLAFADDRRPDAGAQLIDPSGEVVGDVRSVASSPRLGAIGLGMVRREVSEGASLRARWDGQESSATVVSLPFPR